MTVERNTSASARESRIPVYSGHPRPIDSHAASRPQPSPGCTGSGRRGGGPGRGRRGECPGSGRLRRVSDTSPSLLRKDPMQDLRRRAANIANQHYEEQPGTGEPLSAGLPAPRPIGENEEQHKNKEKQERKERDKAEKEEDCDEGEGGGQEQVNGERREGGESIDQENNLWNILEEAADHIKLVRDKVEEFTRELKELSNQVNTSDTMKETTKKKCEDLLKRTKVFSNLMQAERRDESEGPPSYESTVQVPSATKLSRDPADPALLKKVAARRRALQGWDRTDWELLQLRQALAAHLQPLPDLRSLARQLDQDDQHIEKLITEDLQCVSVQEVEQIFQEMETYKDPLKALLKEIDDHKTSSPKHQESEESEFVVNGMTLKDFLDAGFEKKMELLNETATWSILARDTSLQQDLWREIVADSASLLDARSCLDNASLVRLLDWVDGEVTRLGARLDQGGLSGPWLLPRRVQLVVREAALLRQQLERSPRPGTLRWRQVRFLYALHRLLFILTLLPPETLAA